MLKISAKETRETFLGDMEGHCKKKNPLVLSCAVNISNNSALFHKLNAILLALVSDILTGLEHRSL